MPIKTMDPEEVLRLLEGYTNELSGPLSAMEIFYKHQTCPKCRGQSFEKRVDPRHTFNEESLLPRALLLCTACSCLFDPHTGLQLTLGNLAKIPPPVPLIDPKND